MRNKGGDVVVNKVVGIKVNQWRSDWDEVTWDAKAKRAEPQHWFYQFSLPASLLREWSGVNTRTSNRSTSRDDLGIQRRHEPQRSEEISRFVEFGYPWSELSDRKREDSEYNSLRKPGWLPTAIVVNILGPKDQRSGRKVAEGDVIKVTNRKDGLAELHYPDTYKGKGWSITGLPPIEVIDGQHRLWAFDPNSKDDFELPVVAFVGLDLSWQAYLFYTINIKPKKINASLAFDLYPLLRAEDWLDKFEGHIIYRETRAQELVDVLWSHKDSPWHKRINMLGESGQRGKMVTQAAWIRALLATYVRSYEGRNVKLGGLFGSPTGSHDEVLPWSRLEQAAFLILLGSSFKEAIAGAKHPWAEKLRKIGTRDDKAAADDAAFYGEHSLLNQDQGIRALLHVTNDMLYVRADELQLVAIFQDASYGSKDETAVVAEALKVAKRQRALKKFVDDLMLRLAEYDWRAFSAPDLPEGERMKKAGFRGSGGYKELRLSVLKKLQEGSGATADAAEAALELIGG